jgi:hypothetical protein
MAALASGKTFFISDPRNLMFCEAQLNRAALFGPDRHQAHLYPICANRLHENIGLESISDLMGERL